MEPTDLIDEVEERRIRLGMSVLEISEKTGVCRATYYHWVERRTVPRLSQLMAVMDVLGLTLKIVRK